MGAPQPLGRGRDAIEGAFSGGRMDGLPEAFALAISTPEPPVGRFSDIHRRAPGLEDAQAGQDLAGLGHVACEPAELRRGQYHLPPLTAAAAEVTAASALSSPSRVVPENDHPTGTASCSRSCPNPESSCELDHG
ncbi:hypothetical protein ACTMTI_05125 [Nonomuraea sp. H19]|uniref:hypothetical protein n=1 Tax=Nonomuraea sp. H19 TaxID=3452206 RepID=UPI003F8ACA5F